MMVIETLVFGIWMREWVLIKNIGYLYFFPGDKKSKEYKALMLR